MPHDQADLLLRIAAYDPVPDAYPVEATVSDGRQFQGGALRLDRDALQAQALQPEAYGLTLFNALFTGPIKEAYDIALAQAKSLRLRLWIEDGAAELHALPWERLFHPYHGQVVPLAVTANTPFSRYTSLRSPEPEPVTHTPVQLLVILSNPANLPGGLKPAEVDAEIESLRSALTPLQQNGLFRISVLPGRTGISADLQRLLKKAGWQMVDGPASLDNVMRQLPKCHLVHFIGHGHFRREADRGPGQAALYLEDEQGGWVVVRDVDFVTRLVALDARPHLMFLVACDSAKRDVEHPLIGLAPKLVQANIPAVVAMQDMAPMPMVRDLAAEFYRQLAAHGEVDTALNQARLRVFDANGTDWAIPVLFTRLKSGRLFALGEAEAAAPGEPPYKGLRYFDEQDADKFFGRAALSAELVERVQAGRFLAVVGASGSGKSSLVRAGVLPALRRDERTRWHIHVITPTSQPLEALAASLTRDSESVTATATLIDDLRRDPRALHLYAQRLTSGTSARLLLVVDQFEELFTACKDPVVRLAFIDNLMTAAQADGPLTAVLTLRADFYAHCLAFDALRAALEDRQKPIDRLKDSELREAIEEPARRGGWEIEPGLVERVLEDAGDEPGALPLISHALLATWNQRRGRRLTLAGYQAAGGVKQALTRTADETLQHLTPERRAIARRIFTRLTELGEGTQDTRRRAALDELSPRPEEQPEVEQVLALLATARLITTDQAVAEVAHEALIREWGTLRAWLDEDRAGLRLHRQLGEDAHEWVQLGHDEGALYRGVRLAQATAWAEANANELSALERDFVRAGRELTEREAAEENAQRERQLETAHQLFMAEAARARDAEQSAVRLKSRSRVIAGVGILAGVIAIVALVLGWSANQSSLRANQNAAMATVALGQAQQNAATATFALGQAEVQATSAAEGRETAVAAQATAEADRAQAEQQAQIALARQLAAQSQQIIDRQPLYFHRAMLLAIESLRRYPEGEGNEVLGIGLDILPRELGRLTHVGFVNAVAFSPDGRWVVSGSDDGTAHVWETAGGREVARITHAGFVNAVAFSPDGRWVVSGSDDDTARVWEAASGQEVARMVHDNYVNVVAFSPDGQWVLTGSDDDTARVWEAATGREVARLTHDGPVSAVAFSPDGQWVVTGSDDGTARVWEAATGQEVARLTHDDVVFAVTFSPDGRWVASGSGDSTARVWEAATGQELARLTHDDYVTALVFSPDGRWVVSGGYDATARVWEAATGREVARLSHDDSVNTVAFSPDGRWIVSGGDDDTARVWDATSGREIARVIHGHSVRAVAFSSDGREVVSGSWDRTAQAWEVISGREIARPTHDDFVWAVAFSPDGQQVVSGGYDDTARVWEAATGREVARMTYDGPASAVAFNSDGRWVISGGWDGTARVWEAATGREVARMTHGGSVWAVAFSPDGQQVVSGGYDDTARVWEAASGREVARMSHRGYVSVVAFSPDGQWVISGSGDGTARVWEAASGREIARLTHIGPVNAAAFSADGQWVVSGSDDGTARVWEAASGREIARLNHGDVVSAVAFSPDGRWVVTGSGDGTARVWEAASGREIARLTHDFGVNAVAFSPDGQWVVSGSTDHTARVWEAASGREVARLTHGDSVRAVAFSPDGQSVVSGSQDGTVRVWRWRNAELIELACSRLARNLTQAEWQQYLDNEPYRRTCENLPEGE